MFASSSRRTQLWVYSSAFLRILKDKLILSLHVRQLWTSGCLHNVVWASVCLSTSSFLRRSCLELLVMICQSPKFVFISKVCSPHALCWFFFGNSCWCNLDLLCPGFEVDTVEPAVREPPEQGVFLCRDLDETDEINEFSGKNDRSWSPIWTIRRSSSFAKPFPRNNVQIVLKIGKLALCVVHAGGV